MTEAMNNLEAAESELKRARDALQWTLDFAEEHDEEGLIEVARAALSPQPQQDNR